MRCTEVILTPFPSVRPLLLVDSAVCITTRWREYPGVFTFAIFSLVTSRATRCAARLELAELKIDVMLTQISLQIIRG